MAGLPLVSPLDRAVFLKAQPYLAGLPSTAIAALAQHTEERFFSAKEVVYEAGVPPAHIYFLASGGVRTHYEGSPPFDISSPGGIGLIEHLAGSERPPSARALEGTLALSVGVRSFMQIVEDDFVLYMTLVRNLALAVTQALSEDGSRGLPERGFPEDRLQETYATLDLVLRLAQAREAPFFEGSSLTVLTELLRFQQPRVLPEGTTLWKEGSPVESMALVLDGTFVTTRAGAKTVHPTGSMLGGWEIFTSQPRLETAQAATAARIIEIDRALLDDVLEDHFEFAFDYMRKLCRRVIEVRFSLRGSHG